MWILSHKGNTDREGCNDAAAPIHDAVWDHDYGLYLQHVGVHADRTAHRHLGVVLHDGGGDGTDDHDLRVGGGAAVAAADAADLPHGAEEAAAPDGGALRYRADDLWGSDEL